MEVKILKIYVYPSDALFKATDLVAVFDDNLRKTCKQMLDLMYKANGVGLASPQVGISKKIIVIDPIHPDDGEPQPICFINPEIKWFSDKTVSMEEGCLSLPGVYCEVVRPSEIEVKYNDEFGNLHTKKFSDKMARILQHEIDHLNGVVFIDHLSKLKKDMAIKKLTKILKKWENEE